MERATLRKTVSALLSAALIWGSAGLEPFQAFAQPRVAVPRAGAQGVSGAWLPLLQRSFSDISALPPAPGLSASGAGVLERLEPLVADPQGAEAAAPLFKKLEAAGHSPASFSQLPAPERRQVLSRVAVETSKDLEAEAESLIASASKPGAGGPALLETSERLDAVSRLGRVYLEPERAEKVARASAALDGWAADYRKSQLDGKAAAFSARQAGSLSGGREREAAGGRGAVEAQAARYSETQLQGRTAPAAAPTGAPIPVLVKGAGAQAPSAAALASAPESPKADASQMAGSSLREQAPRDWRTVASEVATAGGLLGVALVGGRMMGGLIGGSAAFPFLAGALAFATAQAMVASLAEHRSVIVGGWQASHDQRYRVGPDGNLRDVRGHKYGSDRYEETAPGPVKTWERVAVNGAAFAAGLWAWSAVAAFTAPAYAGVFAGLALFTWLWARWRASQKAAAAPAPSPSPNTQPSK